MFRHRITRSFLALALLVLMAPAVAAFDQVPEQAPDTQRQKRTDIRNAGFGYALPVVRDLVRLEDSLQWRGRDAIEPPVSLFVTGLLPGNC